MWSSPVERAAQLKRQQKVLREQEWNARPEYEKRRVVVSVDVVKGKVVRRMGEVRREDVEGGDEEEEEEEGVEKEIAGSGQEGKGTGVFGRNPLLGGLIKPVWRSKDEAGKGKWPADVRGGDGWAASEDGDKENRLRSGWRRVQDDNDDNEALILDGGVYGGRGDDRMLREEEHAIG